MPGGFSTIFVTLTNPQWLKLPISRTNFHGPKDVRATKFHCAANKDSSEQSDQNLC